MYDIQPGEQLKITLGDPTNPTPIFAQYGFLPNDCATIFCKAMHLDPIIKELGYDFKDLLFQTESGEIAPKVCYSVCCCVCLYVWIEGMRCIVSYHISYTHPCTTPLLYNS